jgi:hypothetical protein
MPVKAGIQASFLGSRQKLVWKTSVQVACSFWPGLKIPLLGRCLRMSPEEIMLLVVCVVFLLFAAVFPSGSPVAWADAGPVRGIYSLMKSQADLNPEVVKLSFVAGVSIRANWKSLEPQRGRVDWSYLDTTLSDAAKAGKKAMLRILPGVHSPEWLEKSGASYFEVKDTNKFHKRFGQEVRGPLPWGETYLREWVKFISEMGRYDSHEELTLVHMAGPTWQSAEMHLPKGSAANTTMLKKAGYSKARIVNAWKMVIDAYVVAFPHKSIALNIAPPLEDDGAKEEIIEYAKAKLGSRLCVQTNQLSDYHKGSPNYCTIKALAASGVNVGFQMLDAATERPERQGSLKSSVGEGLEAGARYFEIYQSDILNQGNRMMLKDLEERLEK